MVAELGEEILLGRQGQEVRVGEDGVEIFAHSKTTPFTIPSKRGKSCLGEDNL